MQTNPAGEQNKIIRESVKSVR